MADKKIRSVVKGLLWRVIATIDTTLLAFLFTGSIRNAFSIGALELITKTFLYYFHERAWIKVLAGWPEENPDRSADHHVSFLKAVSWRFFGVIDTILLSFIVTGDILISASIGGTELVTKILLYYFHERAWKRIRWGKGTRGQAPAL